jgi:hypothetical protein
VKIDHAAALDLVRIQFQAQQDELVCSSPGVPIALKTRSEKKSSNLTILSAAGIKITTLVRKFVRERIVKEQEGRGGRGGGVKDFPKWWNPHNW